MRKSKPTIVACYVRVSTIGQNEAGQRDEIRACLERERLDPLAVKWYLDKESGDTLKRQSFERLQADIAAGKVARVIVSRLDRISRTLRDGINTLDDWIKAGVKLTCATQEIDFAGKFGPALAALLFAFAEMEQQTRRERQQAGIRAAKAKGGVYQGRKPGTFKGKPERARTLHAQGVSAAEIGRALGVSQRTVWRYLQSPAA